MPPGSNPPPPSPASFSTPGSIPPPPSVPPHSSGPTGWPTTKAPSLIDDECMNMNIEQFVLK